MTIALVYNVKKEGASPVAAMAADQSTTPPTDDSPAAVPPAGSAASLLNLSPVPQKRSNDLYAEWDTMDTVLAVRDAIAERHEVLLVEADENAYQVLRDARPDFVFNIAEGLHGVSREAHMPAMYEFLRLPYLGSDPMTLCICLDKARTKEVLSYHGIRTAAFSVFDSMESFEDRRVRFPCIVKPLHEGSSKGVFDSCVVRSPDELEREVRTVLEVYSQPALVEEFLPGREFTVAVMGNGNDLRVLPIVEISFAALPPGANPIYSYEAKWLWDSAEDPLQIFSCPAELDETLLEEIQRMCTVTYTALRCRDWARIDLRLDAAGRPHILEVNPLPGILPRPEDNSCFPKAARAAGLSYNQLIQTVLDIALERCRVPAGVSPVEAPINS